MKPFTVHTGIVAVVDRENIDTDIIIPLQPLMTVPRGQLGPFAFSPLRYGEDGPTPDFFANRRGFAEVSILVAGRNFGSGSSREGAVYALVDMGIRCIIAPSFGDIFHGNCVNNGVLPIRQNPASTRQLMDLYAEAPQTATIDLVRRRVVLPDGSEQPFAVHDADRERLIAGRDHIDYTNLRAKEIAAFRANDRAERPWAWLIPGD